MDKIRGKIINIIYEGNEGFKILNLKLDNRIITLKGNMPMVDLGDNIEAIGNYVEHKNYGMQFDVTTFEKIFPSETEDILDYLQSGAIKGIGPKLAGKIIDRFSDDTLDIIYNDPAKLAEISGVSLKKADEIGREFRAKREFFELSKYLKPYNLRSSDIAKMYAKYKENTLDIIKENPYIIVSSIVNVSFADIDKIAIREGIPLENENRITSAIIYALNISIKNGHTYVTYNNLLEYLKKITGTNEEVIETVLKNIHTQGLINIMEDTVALESVSIAESEIAEKLIRLKNTKSFKITGTVKKITTLEKELDISLTTDQKNAIKAALKNNVTIITGGPGTGKTTITKFIVEIFEKEGKEVEIAAPTGKAAKRIADVTSHSASTIHRMLEIGKYGDDNYNAIFVETKDLTSDVIIIDEASMIDTFMMTYILRGIAEGSKLVLIGDINQLPSVGPGKVLEDIINSETVEVINLKTIFRQAAKSNIILNAHRVNEGKEIQILEDDEHIQDFKIEYVNNLDEIFNLLLLELEKEIKVKGVEDFFYTSQILSPTKRGKCGTENLNMEIQKHFNKETEDKIRYGKVEYKKGDRIIQIKNDYDMSWKLGKHIGTGVFNGEMGIIREVSEAEKLIKIEFDDGKTAIYEKQDLEKIIHSYAITVHKSQGSEFETVILVLSGATPMLLTRNILYTAMSRAKEKLIIIGANYTVKKMIDTISINKRKTLLNEKLKEESKKYE